MIKSFKIYAFATALCATFVFAQEHYEQAEEPIAQVHEEPTPSVQEELFVPESPPEPITLVQEKVLMPEPLQKPAVNAEQESAKEFHFGIRAAFGISAMRGHKAMQSLSFGTNAIRLFPALSGGAGLIFAIEINKLLTIAPELNYTFYRANGNFIVKTDADLRDLNKAGVELHSLELPILARLNFGVAYVEAGPQIGFNINSEVYKNYELKSPNLNVFAFGPSLGGGVNINGILLGFRGHFGLLEYAKRTSGYPWALHFSAAKLFF